MKTIKSKSKSKSKINDKIVIFNKVVRWGVRNNHPFTKWAAEAAVLANLSYSTAYRQLREYLYRTGPNGYKSVLKQSKKPNEYKAVLKQSKKPRA